MKLRQAFKAGAAKLIGQLRILDARMVEALIARRYGSAGDIRQRIQEQSIRYPRMNWREAREENPDFFPEMLKTDELQPGEMQLCRTFEVEPGKTIDWEQRDAAITTARVKRGFPIVSSWADRKSVAVNPRSRHAEIDRLLGCAVPARVERNTLE